MARSTNEGRKNRGGLDQEPRDDHVGDRNLVNIAPLKFVEKIVTGSFLDRGLGPLNLQREQFFRRALRNADRCAGIKKWIYPDAAETETVVLLISRSSQLIASSLSPSPT